MAWYISLTDSAVSWLSLNFRKLRVLGRGVQTQPQSKAAPKTQHVQLVPQCRWQLPASCWLSAHRAGHCSGRFGYQKVWSPQTVHTAQPRNCFLLRGALRVARKICSQELLCREGKCPFLCVPGPQQEFLCCWWQGIPCCVLNQQEIVPLSSLPPWPCSPATASPQSWGGEGRGGKGTLS